MPGNLERCDLPLAVACDLFRPAGFPLFEPDSYGDFFPKFVVGNAIDRSIAYLRMASEKVLDLSGIDVFSATNDHLLLASTDRDISVFILGGEIPGAQPALGGDSLLGSLGLVVVALHDQV